MVSATPDPAPAVTGNAKDTPPEGGTARAPDEGSGVDALPSYSPASAPDSGSTAHVLTASTAPLPTEHTYTLNTQKGQPWLTLRLRSRAPGGNAQKALPVFRDGDVIAGEVSVVMDKPDAAKGISVSIHADNTAVGQEPIPFLDFSTDLWIPTSASPKLSGKQSWPFTLALPRETEPLSDKGLEKGKGKSKKDDDVDRKRYPLPPTFSERASPAYIDYKIIVTVKRGAFRVNQTLGMSFVYIPRWVALPPSALRRLAYSEGSPLLGPDADPEGWKVLPAVTIAGTLFEAKSVEVTATLAIAAPVTYAVGSPVPLQLTLTSTDTQALDLFSTPSAPQIYLTRTIAVGSGATDEHAPRRSNNTFPEHIGRAFWWPAPGTEGAGSGGSTRVLLGEIDVGRGTKPGFVFPRFTIRYHVSLHSFTAPGFAPNTPSDQALLSEKVSIMTDNVPGVSPHSYAPPGYVKPEEGNYNNSMGYLENGNQRFYHHHAGF